MYKIITVAADDAFRVVYSVARTRTTGASPRALCQKGYTVRAWAQRAVVGRFFVFFFYLYTLSDFRATAARVLIIHTYIINLLRAVYPPIYVLAYIVCAYVYVYNIINFYISRRFFFARPQNPDLYGFGSHIHDMFDD